MRYVFRWDGATNFSETIVVETATGWFVRQFSSEVGGAMCHVPDLDHTIEPKLFARTREVPTTRKD